MSVSRHFATDRSTARAHFAAACDAAGLKPAAYHPPAETAASEDPIVEVARLGAADAPVVIALTCGSWEDEGLCASGVQTTFLHGDLARRLPAHVAVVLVHAIAPEGLSGIGSHIASWGPQSPQEWSDQALAAAEDRFASYVNSAGPAFVPLADGSIPWQARLLCRIADEFFQCAQRIALIDLRTGPGKYGEADLLACATATDPSLSRATALFDQAGDATDALPRGTPGNLANGLIAALERTELAAIVLEFGTYSMRSVLAPGKGQVFYPDSEDWHELVWTQTYAVVQRALVSLLQE